MPAKVLHVITGLGVGGAEKMLYKLLKSVDKSQFEMRVVSLKSGGSVADDIRGLGIKVDQLGMKGPSSAVTGIVELRELIRSWKPDLVHAWMYHANLAASLALLGRRIPLVWGIRYSINDLADLKFSTRLVIDLGRIFSKQPDRILYNAHSTAEQHEKYGYSGKRREVIPNGIELDFWANQNQPAGFLRSKTRISIHDPIVGMVARFDPQKDFDTFLDAAVEMHRLRSNVQFVLLGPGVNPSQKSLVRMIRDRGLERAVHLMGEQRDVRPYLRDFDLFTLSSKNGEAFPNVLLEAMAMSLPVVATDVGDCRKIMSDSGLVVSPASPKALAEAWEAILSLSPSERQAWGERERKRVAKNYSIESVRQAYQNLYTDLVG